MSQSDKILGAVFAAILLAAMFDTWWRFVRKVGK